MRKRIIYLLLGLLLSPIIQACADSEAQTQASEETSETQLWIFKDDFLNAFQDWSWGAQNSLENGELSVHIREGWGALRPHSNEAISNVSKVVFNARGNAQTLNVSFETEAYYTEPKAITLTNEMTRYELEHDGSPIIGVAWQDSTGEGLEPFFIDDVYLLIDASMAALPEPTGNAEVSLEVDLQQEQGRINDYIYGMSFADASLAAELDLPINRWGGNAVSRYNWKLSATNKANDWFFLNVPDGPNEGVDENNLPETATFNTFIKNNLNTNTDTLLTIPMLGWTTNGRNDNCSFDVAKYGPQDATEEPWRPHCGNGFQDGQMLYGKSPEDSSMAIDERFTQEWLEYINIRHGDEAVRFVALDNEPMLWNATHRDVFPEPLSYTGIRDLSYRYASAIKKVHPKADILGPVVWGWTAYEFSAADAAAGGDWFLNPVDRNSHGGKAFLAWYLEQMASYEKNNGQRILDYLDIHYYPAQANVAISDDVSLETQKLRLRSTRSLWDSNYKDESWIDQTVQLVPRMKSLIDTEYPGTKLAITEYNWGATKHINGALAQADVLGIFGREGADMAMFWANPSSSEPVAFAFRMYRNYDGQGSKFGDISLNASSSDQDKVSIYAARRSDNAITMVVVNKSLADIEVKLDVAGAKGLVKTYQYGQQNVNAIEQLGDQALSETFILPKNSIRMLVLDNQQ